MDLSYSSLSPSSSSFFLIYLLFSFLPSFFSFSSLTSFHLLFLPLRSSLPSRSSSSSLPPSSHLSPLPSFPLLALLSFPPPQLWLHDGLSLSDDDHELCAKVETTVVPAEGYFGISAATGGLSDDHDVLKFLAFSLLPSEERTEEVRGEGGGGEGVITVIIRMLSLLQ